MKERFILLTKDLPEPVYYLAVLLVIWEDDTYFHLERYTAQMVDCQQIKTYIPCKINCKFKIKNDVFPLENIIKDAKRFATFKLILPHEETTGEYSSLYSDERIQWNETNLSSNNLSPYTSGLYKTFFEKIKTDTNCQYLKELLNISDNIKNCIKIVN